jgi:hypothetical protein
MTAQLPLYAAIYAALAAAPDIGAGIYDAAPQDAAYPHIEIGGGQAYDWSAVLMRGEETVVEIHAWSRYRGYAEARTILGKIKDRLHEVALSLTGAVFVDMRFQDMDVFTDADGVTRHGIIRFRALTTVAS